MVLSRFAPVLRKFLQCQNGATGVAIHNRTLFCTNSAMKNQNILPQEPYRTSFGLIKIVLTVVPGLLIGAAISKNIANFLEENDLFVPSDDDDDDD